jgi:hypothetical protein
VKQIIIVLFLTVSNFTFGQVDLVWGDYTKPFDDGKYIIGANEGHHFSVNYENDIPYLVSYNDLDMKVESYKELKVGKGTKTGSKAKKFTHEEINKRKDVPSGNDFVFENSFILSNKVVLVYYIKEKGVKTYSAQTYDLEGSPVEGPIVLDKFQEKKWATTHYFGVSEDKSMIYMFRQPKLEKEENDKFILKIWDTDLSNQNDVEIELPYENRKAGMYDYFLTSDKKLVCLYTILIPKKERQKNGPDRLIKAMSINIGEGTVNDFELDLKGKFIRDLNLRFDVDQNAYCVGIFCDESNRNKSDGTFYFKLNYKTGAISSEHTESFSKEIIHKMNNSESLKKRNQDLRANIDLRKVHGKPDGGSFVLFEENYIRVVTTRSSNGSTSSTYYYHDNDILVMSLSPQGEILWQNVVPKKQVSTDDGGANGSYYSTVNNGKLCIFYNENIQNFNSGNYDKTAQTKSASTTIPVMVTFSEDGSYETSGIIEFDKKRPYLMSFRDAFYVTNSKAIVYSVGKPGSCCSLPGSGSRKYRVGKLTIE